MFHSKCLWFVVLGYLVVTCHCHSGHHDSQHDDHKDDHRESPPQAQISDHRFFLQEIFTKYGHEGQMTFEGFEHLLESLGLGNIIINDHDVSAHKEDAFRNTHDTHDHSKKDGRSHTEHEPQHGRTRQTAALHQTTKSTGDGRFHSSKPTAYSTVTTPVRNRLRRIETNTIHPSADRTKPEVQLSTQSTQSTRNSTPSTNTAGPESIYHYRLPDAEIPELLVNISSLVDQHQELLHEPQGMVIEQCLSPKEILETFGINENSSLNPVNFLHLCPAIIYELDQGHCMFQDLSHRKHKTAATFYQWMYALLAVLAISMCGLLSVAVIPIMQKWFYHTLLQFLVGLAVGSLSGDGLLHLMPHAMLAGDGGHGGGSILPEVAERTAVWRGFTALGGILFFFVAERLLAVITTRKAVEKKPSEVDSQCAEVVLYSDGRVGQKLSQYRKNSHLELSEKEVMHMLAHASPKNPNKEVPELHGGHGHGHSHNHDVPQSITAVAWMVIMGDGLHNFCDGLAIGAAFASGIEGGISTTVAVFCHELPHELGDFAMLLRTGMGARRALLYNVLSSGLCFAGTALGLCLGGVHSATGWVFAITAGIFLYVALVDMLPELSASSDPNSSPLHQLAIQVLGISTGVSIMLIIANYEQDLQSIVS